MVKPLSFGKTFLFSSQNLFPSWLNLYTSWLNFYLLAKPYYFLANLFYFMAKPLSLSKKSLLHSYTSISWQNLYFLTTLFYFMEKLLPLGKTIKFLSNDMWHATCMQGNQGDSRLLMVGSHEHLDQHLF